MDQFTSLPLDLQRYILKYLTPEEQDKFVKAYPNRTIANPDDVIWLERMKEDFGLNYRQNYFILKDYKKRIGDKEFYITYSRYDKVIQSMYLGLEMVLFRMLVDGLQLLKGNLEVFDMNDHTMLMQAVMSEDIPTIKKILDAGANINTRNKHGETALMLAYHNKQCLAICKMLLAAGAEINPRTANEGTILTKMMGSMIHKSTISENTINIIKFFVEHGIDINAKGPVGASFYAHHLSVLGILVKYFSSYPYVISLINYLISHGADVNTRIEDWTCLMYLALYSKQHSGNLELMKIFFKAKANLELTNNVGNTALLVAAQRYGEGSTKETLSTLIEAGANVNAQNNDGDTALHALLYNKKPSGPGILVLLKAGADVNIKNKAGRDILSLASETKVSEEVKNKLKSTVKASKRRAALKARTVRA